MQRAEVLGYILATVWRIGSDVDQINEVTLRRARSVLGWVTVSGVQPGHPFVGMRNEYRSKGGDALRLGSKADMVLFTGNTV